MDIVIGEKGRALISLVTGCAILGFIAFLVLSPTGLFHDYVIRFISQTYGG